MIPNKKNITAEHARQWLASCGFLFPSTEKELEHFHALFGEMDSNITGKEVDPFKIIEATKQKNNIAASIHSLYPTNQDDYQMVAAKEPSMAPKKVNTTKRQKNNEDSNEDTK